ncbi:MAG: hypothetical protein RDV48_18705 [Candidatus Eremiobacteraeota bacterium]|nr:hypothetical protein [Candidatus Eremiobacteraeota bacterium]
MEKKDALVIIILIILATFLGSVIVTQRPPRAVVTRKGEKANVVNIFIHPKLKQPDLTINQLISGTMVLNADREYALNDRQKKDMLACLGEIKQKQQDYKKLSNEIDDSKDKILKVLTEKQVKFITQNKEEIMIQFQARMGRAGSESSELLTQFEKTLNKK